MPRRSLSQFFQIFLCVRKDQRVDLDCDLKGEERYSRTTLSPSVPKASQTQGILGCAGKGGLMFLIGPKEKKKKGKKEGK